MRERVFKAFLYVFVALLIFSVFRISIYLNYFESFRNLTAYEVLQSFFMGLRVDIITLFTFTSLIILLLILPFSFADHKRYQQGLAILFWLVLVCMIGALFGDYLYFEHVHRHTSSEIFYLKGDDFSVVLEVLKANFLGVLWILLLYVLLFFFFRNVSARSARTVSFGVKSFSVFFLVFFILFAGIRGKVLGKPFGIVDAFSSSKAESGHLALNGIYSVYRSSSRDGKAERFMPDKKALNITKRLLADPRFEFINADYPLIKRLQKGNQSAATLRLRSDVKPNVAIVLLEGWSSLYVDSFSGVGFKATPHFDALAEQGIIYRNFFSNGQRSIDGITALFTGIPRVAGINRLGSGLESSHVSFLGDLAIMNGYQTLAMQSSKRSSFRLDSIARLAGFEEYYGAEDIPELNLETSGQQPYFGTWDNNTFQFLLGKINQAKEEDPEKPFLAFAFSSSTHTPFVSPGKEWEIYEHNDQDMYGFLNTLYYADSVIGDFMSKASEQSWFDNTIFIFMADHTVGFGEENFLKDFAAPSRHTENMRIPMLVYAPALLDPAVDDRPASQADIIPSLVDLLSWQGSFSSISNSLFSEAPRFAVLEQGPVITYVREDGYLNHNLNRILENTLEDKEAEKELLGVYQTVSTLLFENRFYRSHVDQ